MEASWSEKRERGGAEERRVPRRGSGSQPRLSFQCKNRRTNGEQEAERQLPGPMGGAFFANSGSGVLWGAAGQADSAGSRYAVSGRGSGRAVRVFEASGRRTPTGG